MNLRELAKKEIDRIEKIFDNLILLNNSKEVLELIELAKTYFQDSKNFYQKKDFLRAFEAVVIAWSYIDAGLHLKVFDLPKELKRYFTVE